MWGCKWEFRGIKLPFNNLLCTVIFMRCDLLSALTTTTTPSAWQLAAETCPLRRLMLERARESIAFQRRLRLWDQLPAQALRFSHGWGERETRVTGDWPQGTMGRVQTLSPSRLPLRAHRRETSGYEAAMRSYRIGLLFTHKNGDLQRDFCTGGKLRRTDLGSEASHIGLVPCHTLVQCGPVFAP